MATITITPEPTPNPRAMKFTTNVILNEGAGRSYYSAAAAAGDPIASRIFALEGVTGVLIVGDFCTVNQDGSRNWSELIPRVEQILCEQVTHRQVP
ncbi:MAG TPA: NifU N-terminal domain-containing protein [Phycisphaerae bacterium]|jgi:hypothetical protein